MTTITDLSGTNKIVLLLNIHGDPTFLFQNSSPYNINSQEAKFDKNLNAGFVSIWSEIMRDFKINELHSMNLI